MPLELAQHTNESGSRFTRRFAAKRLSDGRVEVVLEERALRYGRKRWHTTLGIIVLTANQACQLQAFLAESF